MSRSPFGFKFNRRGQVVDTKWDAEIRQQKRDARLQRLCRTGGPLDVVLVLIVMLLLLPFWLLGLLWDRLRRRKRS